MPDIPEPEANAIHDKAIAIAAYARQAENTELEADAARIKWRAKERLGELLADTELHKGGRPSKTPSESEGVSKLSDAKISYKLSSESQQVAALPVAEKTKALADSNPDDAMKHLLSVTRRTAVLPLPNWKGHFPIGSLPDW
jgi:hypothetical protein